MAWRLQRVWNIYLSIRMCSSVKKKIIIIKNLRSVIYSLLGGLVQHYRSRKRHLTTAHGRRTCRNQLYPLSPQVSTSGWHGGVHCLQNVYFYSPHTVCHSFSFSIFVSLFSCCTIFPSLTLTLFAFILFS